MFHVNIFINKCKCIGDNTPSDQEDILGQDDFRNFSADAGKLFAENS